MDAVASILKADIVQKLMAQKHMMIREWERLCFAQ